MFENITVIGTGYVGLSLATLLAQSKNVIALDIDEEKVNKINKRISPIEDPKIQEFFSTKNLKLEATLDKEYALKNTDVVIIATPTDYDDVTNSFNTQSIESNLEYLIKLGLDIPVIIKSTIPIGYVDELERKYRYKGELIFSPEFLREGKALEDNLFPSRIVLGSKSNEAMAFGKLLQSHALNAENVDVILMSNKEAEAVKLFSNTYLAMRVSFFNELDTFAEVQSLDSTNIIKGVSADPRIGDHYNNPSFGYGGYCLPKDTKQLRANYTNIPESIISSIVESNQIRKEHIAEMIMKKKPKTVGVYKLAMKSGSDNFRQSSIIDVINILENNDVKVIVFEPLLKGQISEFVIEENFEKFINESDVIMTNRLEDELKIVENKVYTRDVFNRD